MKETTRISLENFNSSRKKPPYLTSPRSIEACRRLGVDPSELLVKEKEEFLKEECKGLDAEAAELKYESFVNRRQYKFELVSEERKKLIEEESKGLWTFSKASGTASKQSIDSNLSSTLIEREKRELERIQRRQQQEIQQIIEHEVKTEKIRERNEEKAAKSKEKEAKRQLELKEKHRQQEIKRRQEEERKKRLAEEEAALQKQRAQEEFDRQQSHKEEEALKEKQRKKEAKERERIAAQKREEFQKNTEELLLQQKLLVEERKQEMEMKEHKRKAKIEEQMQKRKEQSLQQQAYKAAKLATARENLAALLETQRQNFERQQQMNERKRKQFEEERKQMLEENRRRALEKAEEIKQVIKSNQTKEEQRKLNYLKHKEEVEKRQALLTKLKEEEIKQKAIAAQQRQEKIEQVKETNQALVTTRIDKVLYKQKKKDEAVLKVKSAQQRNLVLKKTAEEIKRQERLDTVKMMARQQEYQREKIMDRIQGEYDRIQHLQLEKSAIIEQRKKLRLDVEQQKKQIIEKFERIKKQKGGISNTDELTSMLKVVKTPSTESHGASSKPITSPKPQIFSIETNAYNTTNAETKGFVARQLKKPATTEKLLTSARTKLEAIKKQQLDEMSQLLAYEQSQESHRESQLEATIDASQRDLLEKQFGLERALASQRILKLSEKHAKRLKKLEAKV